MLQAVSKGGGSIDSHGDTFSNFVIDRYSLCFGQRDCESRRRKAFCWVEACSKHGNVALASIRAFNDRLVN